MLPPVGYNTNPQPTTSSSGGSNTSKPKKGGALPPVGEWNYKNAVTGPTGEDLPQGAQSWTPEGNPYFGGGITGKIKEYTYMFTKDIPQVDASVWTEIKQRWTALNKAAAKNTTPGLIDTDEERQQSLEFGKLAVETVKTAWQAGSANESVVSPVLRGVSVSVKAIGDIFSLPAIGIERALGAGQGLQDVANSLESPLPKLDSNWFTKLIEETPIGMAYDWTRIALSPEQDKWSQVATGIEEGWQAGRIFYSQVFDQTLKEQFLRRYRAGENPEMLAMELQNPLAEMGGQILLDPLNLVSVWTKGAKFATDIDNAQQAVRATGVFADADATKAMDTILSQTTDEALIVKSWETVVQAQKKAVETVEGSRIFNNDFTRKALTQGSRVKLSTAHASDYVGLLVSTMKKEGRGFDDIGDAILMGVKSVSKNENEMQQGLQALAHLPSPHLWMNDDANQTWVLMRNLLTNEAGDIDATKLLRLQDKKDLASFSEAAGNLIQQAAKSQFPDVQEMKVAAQQYAKATKEGSTVSAKTKDMADTYNNLSPAVIALDTIHTQLSKPKDWINSWLAMDYFGLRTGTAVKNMATNTEFILLDKGVSAWTREILTADGKSKKAYWSLGAASEYLDDVYGFKASATSGFDTLTKAESQGTVSLFGKEFKLPGSKIMEAAETGAATRIFASATRDTLKKLIKPGAALPQLEVLQTAGMTEKQANQYAKFIYHFNGDTEKAVEAFRKMYAGGSADEWRHLDFVTNTYQGALENLGFWDDIQDFARNGGKSKEEIETFFTSLRKAVTDRAKDASMDKVGVSSDHPALELIGQLDEQVRLGNLDAGSQEVFKAVMQASQQAKNEYMTELNQAVRLIHTRLSMQGQVDTATQIGKDYDKIFQAFLTGGEETKKVTNDMLFSTRAFYKEIKDLKNPTPADLVSYWKQADLAGAPPLDLTKQSLIDTLWNQHRDKVGGEWNTYFDALFDQSDGLVKQFSKFIDSTELESQFSRARNAVAQAQAYREAVYEAGRLRMNPKNDLNWLASQYGIASASESGKGTGKAVLNIINKYAGAPAEDAVRVVRNMNKAVETPVSHLPAPVANRFREEAKRLLSELSGGEGPGITKAVQGEDIAQTRFGTTNTQWYKDLPDELKRRKGIEKALQKIVDGADDNSENVRRMKEMILDNLKHGNADSGTPPDLSVLQEMDATADEMQRALDAFNDITGNDFSLTEAIRKSGGLPTNARYEKLEDVPWETAKAAFERRRLEKGLPEVKLTGIPIYPPMTDSMPSFARGWQENSRGALYMLDDIKNNIIQRYGQKTAGSFDPSIEKAMRQYNADSVGRIAESKAIAMKIATEQRNFTLLNYGERTYSDVALSYLMPYHFFYSRQYNNLFKRMAQNPHIVAGYAKFKSAMENMHKDMPDWYKQQVQINPFAEGAIFERPGGELLGFPVDHPLFINLEASINPIYGLTGTDFNNPNKRVDWFSASVDDIGKFGPSMWAPIQMAMAAAYSLKGQEDASAAWGTRLLPITQEIKTISSFLPFLNKPLELDPSVNLFGGGHDYYERSRIGATIMDMAQQKIQDVQNDPNLTQREKDALIGEIQAQASDAAYNQEGAIWDEAYKQSIQDRAGTVFGGWMFGVGGKPRKESDIQMEKMFTDLNRLYNLSDDLTTEEYRKAYDNISAMYPGMEAALLARKGGEKRDAAFAYGVLNRLPPGNLTPVLESVGLTQQDISKFYDSKGFTSKDVSYTETEKMRFMATVIDLATMLAIPPDSTRQEWTAARNAYSEAKTDIQVALGDDVWDKVNLWYDLKDDNRQAADQFKQQHPEIQQALTALQQQKVMNPLLNAYYGGIDVVEAYVGGSVRAQLEQTYGKDIYDLQTEYYNRKVASESDARSFLSKHTELKKFWSEKRVLDEEANRRFIEIASKIPEGQGAGIRLGFEPESGAQLQLMAAMEGNQEAGWDELSGMMSPQLQQRVINYWMNGEALPKAAMSELAFLANKEGYFNDDALLRRAGLALFNSNGGGGGESNFTPPQPQPLGLPSIGY